MRLIRSIFTSIPVVLLLTLNSSCLAAHPAPVSVDFGTDFFGDDGQWSAATVRVGTSPQYLSLFPATTGQDIKVIGPAGCDGTLTCRSLRGGTFFSNTSSTWANLGYFDLGYSALSDTTEYGNYGVDVVALTDTISVVDQTIAIINSTETWLGELGLGVQQTRFENNTDYATLLSTLVQNRSAIPSHSYGYTAGAYYRQKSISGSLTLGGVDTTRFISNDVSFTLSQGYIPIVAITSITVQSESVSGSLPAPPGWSTNPLVLLNTSQAALFTIDTSTAYLWLPGAVCDNIANALNLTYDDTLELYMYANDSSPNILAALGLSFVFTLANTPKSLQTIELALPFDAFNHQLSYPFPGLNATYSSSPTNYFPLRRANSSQQYTIGRAFLQETYLIVDYERNNFSLSQAFFSDSVQVPQLVAIERPPNSQWPGPQGAIPGLSKGAQAGIGAGIGILVIIILCLIVWYCCVMKRRKPRSEDKPSKNRKTNVLKFFNHRKPASKGHVSELFGDKRQPTEMIADSSNSRFELAATTPVEMPAEEVSSSYLSAEALANSRNESRRHNELTTARHRRDSTNKDALVNEINLGRSTSPTPVYTSTDPRQRLNGSGNNTNPSHSNTIGTASSGEQAISPVGYGSGSNGTSDKQSPVSPLATTSRYSRLHDHRSTSSSNNARSTSGSGNGDANATDKQGMYLSPNSVQRIPSRSLSRNSRFREELAPEDERTLESTGGLQPRPSLNDSQRPSGRKRFSWEQQGEDV